MLPRKISWALPILALVLILVVAVMSAGTAAAQEEVTQVSIDKEWDGLVGGNATIVLLDDSGSQVGPPCVIGATTICLLDVTAGSYTVRETDLPAGSVLVGYTPSDGFDADGTTVTVLAGETATVVVTNKVIDDLHLRTEIHSEDHTPIPFGSSVAAGTVIHDHAFLTAPADGPAPDGQVTFTRYDNSTCTGQGIAGSPVQVDNTEFDAASIDHVIVDSDISYSVTYSESFYGFIPAGIPECENLGEGSPDEVLAVGGVTGFIVGGSDSASRGSAALLGGGIAAVVAVAASGWYARRRWSSRRTG